MAHSGAAPIWWAAALQQFDRFRRTVAWRGRGRIRTRSSEEGEAGDDGHDDDQGSKFFDAKSGVWERHPDVARYNPPAATLPLPFHFYGQPFYKGFSWETKV